MGRFVKLFLAACVGLLIHRGACAAEPDDDFGEAAVASDKPSAQPAGVVQPTATPDGRGGARPTTAAPGVPRYRSLGDKGTKQPAPAQEAATEAQEADGLNDGDAIPDVRARYRQRRRSPSVETEETTSDSETPDPSASSKRPAAAVESPATEAEELRPLTFQGITPGESTQAEVRKQWGQPDDQAIDGDQAEDHFTVVPYRRVIVRYSGQVVQTIAVELAKPLNLADVRDGLGVSELVAARVLDDDGQLLGLAIPERGVLLNLVERGPGEVAPEKAGQDTVAQVIVEPITGSAYALRAEQRMASDPSLAYEDSRRAVTLAADDMIVRWSYAKALAAIGRVEEGREEIARILAAEPNNSEYRLTSARLHRMAGDHEAAIADVEQLLRTEELPVMVEAPARLLLGDLYAEGRDRDFARASTEHMKAIQQALPLAKSDKAPQRQLAREWLFEGHLGMSFDIAWGDFQDRPAAVTTWLTKAGALSQKMNGTEADAAARGLKLAGVALAAQVGLSDAGSDPAPWVTLAKTHATTLKGLVSDPLRHRQIDWDLGQALYDAMQIELALNRIESAERYGQTAAELLDSLSRDVSVVRDRSWLVGRLYYRMGMLQAQHHQDHKQAVVWFERALPLVTAPIVAGSVGDVARQGETLVSIAVSYWEAGHRQEAARLTLDGLEYLEQGIEEGLIEEQALAVPFGNLSFMYAQLGDRVNSQRYAELSAARSGGKRR